MYVLDFDFSRYKAVYFTLAPAQVLSHPDEALLCSNTPRPVYRMRRIDLIEAGTLCIFYSLLLCNRSWVTERSRPKTSGSL